MSQELRAKSEITNPDKLSEPAELLEKGAKNLVLKVNPEEVKVSELLAAVKRPLFGTLSIGQVNARCIAVPESEEYIVAFEEDFSIFCLLISKAVARAVPLLKTRTGGLSWSLKDEGARNHLRTNKQSVKRVAQMIIAYLIKGCVGFAGPYLIDEPCGLLTDIIADPMSL